MQVIKRKNGTTYYREKIYIDGKPLYSHVLRRRAMLYVGRPALKKHILPLFGDLYLDKVQIAHAHQLIATLLEKGHNAKGVNLILGVFKRVMTEATRDGKIEKNPFQYLRDLKVAPRPDVYMTGDEVNRVLQVSRGHYFYSLFLIVVNTGMRRGEIAGQCWDKVNFRTSLIEIARLRDRNGLGDRTKTFKVDASFP